jgi:hypothetical protein
VIDLETVRAEVRRSDIVALAQQMFVLQVGRHGRLWEEHSKDVYTTMAKEALAAAEAFITESRK